MFLILCFNIIMFNEVLNNSQIRPPYNKVFNWAEALPKNIILKNKFRQKIYLKKLVLLFLFIITMMYQNV